MNIISIKLNIIISIKKYKKFDDNIILIHLIDQLIVNYHLQLIDCITQLPTNVSTESIILTNGNSYKNIYFHSYEELNYQIKISRVFNDRYDYECEITYAKDNEHLNPNNIIRNEFNFVQEYIKKKYNQYGFDWYIDYQIKDK
jgi:hypothetical protein